MIVASYLGIPVVLVEDHVDGWVTALWPDRLNPGRSHGEPKPFTYRNLAWWLLWRPQARPCDAKVELPELPVMLLPKRVPEDGRDTRRFSQPRMVA